MCEIAVDLTPRELVDWVIADRAREGGHIDYFERTRVDFDIEETFDRAAYDLKDGENYDLISVRAILDVEPLVEQNYWVLRATIEQQLGPQPTDREDAFISGAIDPETFRDSYASASDAKSSVSVMVQTDKARQHFDDWLATMRGAHHAGN